MKKLGVAALCVAVSACLSAVAVWSPCGVEKAGPSAEVVMGVEAHPYLAKGEADESFSIDDYVDYAELATEDDSQTEVNSGVADLSDEKCISAETFSDYEIRDGKAAGAVIEYDEIVEMTVDGLRPDDTSAGKSNLAKIESVMDDIRAKNGSSRYENTLFHVTIPEGVYYIDCRYSKKTRRCLHLYSNTWLTMNGVTLIKSDSVQQAMVRGGRSGVSISGTSGEHNIIVEGGTIDMNTARFSGSHTHFTGVRFGHANNIIFANVHFKGAVSGHHLELCGVDNVSVVGCTFSDYKDTGHVKGINRNEALQIDVTHNSTVAPTFGRYDDTASGNVVVYGNTFRNLSRGVGSHSAVYGKYYNDIVIEKNLFEDIYSHAVYGQNYVNCYVVGNKIRRCGAGIEINACGRAPDGNYYAPNSGSAPYVEVKAPDGNIEVAKNKIELDVTSKLNSACGISVHGGVAPTYKKPIELGDVRVHSNTVRASSGTGISLAYVRDFDVRGNKVSNVIKSQSGSGVGIALVDSGSGTVRNNVVAQCDANGVRIQSCSGTKGKRMTVDGNQILLDSDMMSGVLMTGSSYAELTRNTITSDGNPVTLEACMDVDIGRETKDNSLTTARKYAVHVKGDANKSVKVQHNIATAAESVVNAAPGVTEGDNLYTAPTPDDAWSESDIGAVIQPNKPEERKAEDSRYAELDDDDDDVDLAAYGRAEPSDPMDYEPVPLTSR